MLAQEIAPNECTIKSFFNKWEKEKNTCFVHRMKNPGTYYRKCLVRDEVKSSISHLPCGVILENFCESSTWKIVFTLKI